MGYAPGTAHLNVRWARPPWSPAAHSLQRHAERMARSGLTLGNWDSGTGEEPRGLVGTQPRGADPRGRTSHMERGKQGKSLKGFRVGMAIFCDKRPVNRYFCLVRPSPGTIHLDHSSPETTTHNPQHQPGL